MLVYLEIRNYDLLNVIFFALFKVCFINKFLSGTKLTEYLKIVMLHFLIFVGEVVQG